MKIVSNAYSKHSAHKSGKSRIRAGKIRESKTKGNIDHFPPEAKDNYRCYAVFDVETVKAIWEQNFSCDWSFASDVLAHLAEDASYKIRDLANRIKIFSRHSGGTVTCNLVNEVLKECDVSPIFEETKGAWDVIDSNNGSFFYQTDQFVDLRAEYQLNVTVTIPLNIELSTFWSLEKRRLKSIIDYIPNLIYASIYGNNNSSSEALQLLAFTPQIGTFGRVITEDLIRFMVLKQSDIINQRCWRIIQALVFNPYSRDIDSREEYFHLAEILICQLLGPLESIQITEKETPERYLSKNSDQIDYEQEVRNKIKEEISAEALSNSEGLKRVDKIYKLKLHDDSDEALTYLNEKQPENSPYFAFPVSCAYVDVLCDTIGLLATHNGFFQKECYFLILKRLQRFFEKKNINLEKDFIFFNRSIRGLATLGELSFRELTLFIYNMQVDNIPEHFLGGFAQAAVFLNGQDIFLYEWLEHLCGDMLQPFLLYSANYLQAVTKMSQRSEDTTPKIHARTGFRKLKFKCDASNKYLIAKQLMCDYFPEKDTAVLNSDMETKIKFKFLGNRPVIEPKCEDQCKTKCHRGTKCSNNVIIATKKLYKPFQSRKRSLSLSSFYFIRI